MDILNSLKKYKDILLENDLSFYYQELHTNDYTEDYINECTELLTEIYHERFEKNLEPVNDGDSIDKKQKDHDIISLDIGPELFKQNYDLVKLSSNIEELGNFFAKYVNSENFEKYISVIDKNEYDILLSRVKFSEDVLDKFYNLFDPNVISTTQKFSEDFCKRHFDDLNINAVIAANNNDWCDKAKRSKEFSLYLRLKGVRN